MKDALIYALAGYFGAIALYTLISVLVAFGILFLAFFPPIGMFFLLIGACIVKDRLKEGS